MEDPITGEEMQSFPVVSTSVWRLVIGGFSPPAEVAAVIAWYGLAWHHVSTESSAEALDESKIR